MFASPTKTAAPTVSEKGRLGQSVQFLAGIGPIRAKALSEAGIQTVEELLEYFPRGYLDRRNIVPIKDVHLTEREITVVGKIAFAELVRGRRAHRLIVGIEDGTGYLQCVWFQGTTYWERVLKPGLTVAASGVVRYYDGYQLAHPAIDILSEDDDDRLYQTGQIVSLYPSNLFLRKVGLDSRAIRRSIYAALNLARPELVDAFPDDYLRAANVPQRGDAIEAIHFPKDDNTLRSGWNRIKYEELFFFQLLFALRRRAVKAPERGLPFETVGEITRQVLAALPFKLTEGQKAVLHEIRQDLQSPMAMQRLLQGEVGSGKTMVALLAMAMAADSGYQSALMAPTELLADQHARNLSPLVEAAGLHLRLVRGKQSAQERREILSAIATGEAQIVVGTHALLEQKVKFEKLGLVIIDEQHRFGVVQRTLLREKGPMPHLLLMTATPIPRTLTLSHFGDLDVSILRELPAGKRRVTTVLRTGAERDKIYHFIIETAQKGDRVFILCPLVEESEKIDTEAAMEYHARVQAGVFRDFKVGLLHGRQKSEEKSATLIKFRSGEIKILVATPVVEVGVDVPDATVMLIEGAERFGLSQLHQLRGRIGRKGQQAFCILLPGPHITEEAQARMDAICATDDGFELAERDLALRGGGEFFGTRQHGEIELRWANPEQDRILLLIAREQAFSLVERDPELQTVPKLRAHFEHRHAHRLQFVAAG
ncbi:MAG: ATP-dependent DNA helicase RecG [bacterium]